MQVGDLVKKRWGCTYPHQQDTVGVVLSRHWRDYKDYITVVDPNNPPVEYRRNDFEVISASR